LSKAFNHAVDNGFIAKISINILTTGELLSEASTGGNSGELIEVC